MHTAWRRRTGQVTDELVRRQTKHPGEGDPEPTRMRTALLERGSKDKVEIPCSPQPCWWW